MVKPPSERVTASLRSLHRTTLKFVAPRGVSGAPQMTLSQYANSRTPLGQPVMSITVQTFVGIHSDAHTGHYVYMCVSMYIYINIYIYYVCICVCIYMYTYKTFFKTSIDSLVVNNPLKSQ